MKTRDVEVIRQRISVTLPKECVEWLDKQVKVRRYYNRSHAIEGLILEEMKGKKSVNRQEGEGKQEPS